ncbi:hypothetical protein [Paenibacillus monticola]|nr:hypothetical protein [Paenibacillus monticola]
MLCNDSLAATPQCLRVKVTPTTEREQQSEWQRRITVPVGVSPLA